ncbi:MAG: trypsin-like peptidase domain-containing protein [Gemmatimonadaceae bacterium]|nr:trypsin-like peptidase domain-containing protein [Gemmatimonadaceae bacterium]
MAIELRITSGARSGARERFDKAVVAIGRHPINDLRFDVDRDLEVSSRHAEIRAVEGRHLLVDIGSTNGTFVNDKRLSGEHELKDGDVIRFGGEGPTAEFRVAASAAAGAAPSTKLSTPSKGAPKQGQGRLGTEVRVAMAVEKQTGALKRFVIGLTAVVIVGAGAAVWMTQKTAAEGRAQLQALLAANDSLSRALERKLEETGIADASLAAARAETERIASELRAQQARGGDVAPLAAEMRDQQARTARIAAMDYGTIAAANQPAVVFLAVEFADATLASGTGFNVLESGLIVTNRHVVQREDGTRAQRIAVAFDGTSGEWKRASIELVSATDEIALLRITTSGRYPVVRGVARNGAATRLGAPAAILGYPLGTGLEGMGGNINTLRPTATLSVGTVSRILAETVQLDAFAAQGSSGSPVFDSNGHVMGVIYGGATESGGRIVYAVPSSRLASMLPMDALEILR